MRLDQRRPRSASSLGSASPEARRPNVASLRKPLARFKERVRETTGRTRGASLDQIVNDLSRYLVGWRGYFGFCETPSALGALDQ